MNNIPGINNHLFVLIFLIISTLPLGLVTAQSTSYENSSLVIVKASEMTGNQYADLSNALASDNRYSLEYTCLQSGVIVVRYYHNFMEKGDVSTAVRSAMRRFGKLTSLEVIYVDISKESTAQC